LVWSIGKCTIIEIKNRTGENALTKGVRADIVDLPTNEIFELGVHKDLC
jgi:hypothetical protein